MSKEKTMNIPFAKPAICCAEKKAVFEVLNSGHLTTGKKTAEFEEKFAEYMGSTYAVFVNSCTSALKLSLLWKKQQGAKTVGVPSLTFCATVNEVVEAGMEPVFCDVYEDNLCIDQPWPIKVDLWLPVHLGGNWASMSVDSEVIYDSAHLIDKTCHVYGSISCYSFYPTKNMTTGEGGMVCCDDEKMYEWLKKARHHGRAKAIGHADVEFISGKYNNTDIAAAIGLAQLEKLDGFNKRRDEIVDLYNEELGQDWTGNHLYMIKVKQRDEFVQKMHELGIGVSVHFHPVHQMTAYKDYDVSLPVTERLGRQIVSLPIYPQLTNKEVKYICEKVKQSDLLLPWRV